MPEIFIDETEWYPVYVPTEEPRFEGQTPHKVAPEVLARWRAANVAFETAQAEMRATLDPLCPECGHYQSAHQEWSAGWDRWGCLASGCQCQHGIPADRVGA